MRRVLPALLLLLTVLASPRLGASLYHYDGRGDVVALTGNTGNVTYAAEYNAFGTHATSLNVTTNVTTTGTQEAGTDADLFRLTTKEEDAWGGVYDISRELDLGTNTWMQRDPAGMVNGPNPYTYVEQNPWTKFDPDGRLAIPYPALPELGPLGWAILGGTAIYYGGYELYEHYHQATPPPASDQSPAPTTAAPSSGPVQKQTITTPPTTTAPPISNSTGGSATPAIPNSTGGTSAAPLPNSTPGGSTTPLPITTPGQQVTPSGSASGADILNSVLQGQTATSTPGVIYKVPGSNTPSGQPYIGRTTNPQGPPGRGTADGRDRNGAEILDTYGDTQEGRVKEQKAIDDNGGLGELDNKRNEISNEKREENGLPPAQ